jgi:hypothetical protein
VGRAMIGIELKKIVLELVKKAYGQRIGNQCY